eukprot:gene12672-13972_t
MDELTEEEQIEELKNCYSLFDRVGDMKVEYTKIVDVLRSLGLNPLTEEVNKCLEDSKLIHQRIDFETFYGIYLQMSKNPTKGSYSDMVEGLGTLDRDQSGMVNSGELRLTLMNISDRMNEDQVDAIITPHEDGSKNVAYKDMIKTVMSA